MEAKHGSTFPRWKMNCKFGSQLNIFAYRNGTNSIKDQCCHLQADRAQLFRVSAHILCWLQDDFTSCIRLRSYQAKVSIVQGQKCFWVKNSCTEWLIFNRFCASFKKTTTGCSGGTLSWRTSWTSSGEPSVMELLSSRVDEGSYRPTG